jgi:hypothetical protein
MTRERATLGWRESLVITERLTYDSPVDALVALVRTLMAYEQRSHMGSAEFFAQYQAGKLGDAGDIVDWAGDYQQYLGLLQELKARLKAAG